LPAPEPAAAAAPAAGGASIASTSAADFVLTEVAKLHDVSNEMIDHAAQSLLRMGDIGRTAAVRALASDHAPTLMVGAKALLQTGVASDCELVQERLRTKLPTGACTALVDSLAALDPVHASPTFLAELLAHRQTAVRTAVQRHLSKVVPDLPASALAGAAQSKDSDARLRAVQLLASTNDPAALGMLIEHLDDSNPQVARRVVDSLAMREDDTLDADLLRRAFDGRWVLRAQAYALLAICEREDSRLAPQLSEAHAQRLLEGLNASDPFVAGTCAAALAGIGFRSADAEATKWLDLEVPHRLVRSVAAEDFSADFSALVPTAQRRLTMITGESFGSDGPQWIAWWSEHARTFHASRAALSCNRRKPARSRSR
jgi:HEAT repeat protein